MALCYAGDSLAAMKGEKLLELKLGQLLQVAATADRVAHFEKELVKSGTKPLDDASRKAVTACIDKMEEGNRLMEDQMAGATLTERERGFVREINAFRSAAVKNWILMNPREERKDISRKYQKLLDSQGVKAVDFANASTPSGGQAAVTSAIAAEPRTERWAVVASKQVDEMGVTDLVQVGLARLGGLQLVDRESLDRVLKERNLSALTGAEAGQRIKLGRAVRADVLLLLSLEQYEKQAFVRLVVCDCGCGARLRVEYVAFEPAAIPDLAEKIVQQVRQVRQHFAEGVAQVFGVPPFVSRTLTHEYDHLQRGYSALLTNALSLQPGVAVIEVEEARQIAREISLTDGKDINRVVPLFIEGEYEVTRNGSEEPVVEFRVKITGARADERTLPARKVKLSEAARYVGGELPILASGAEKIAPGGRLTPDQEAAHLIARAQVFASLGGWEHSIGLREAALLLKDDPAQRLLLLKEYRGIVAAPLPASMKSGTEDYKSLCRSRWQVWQSALLHVEYLIRNQQIDPRRACDAITNLFWYGALRIIENADREDLAQAEQARRRFVRSIYGPLLKLPRNGMSVSYVRQITQSVAGSLAKYRVDCPHSNHPPVDIRYDEEYLDFIYDLMENATPADEYFRPSLAYDLAGFAFEYGSRKKFLAFFDRLARSSRLESRLTGRLGRLCQEWAVAKGASQPLEPLLERAKALGNEFTGQPKIAEANQDQLGVLSQLRQDIAYAIQQRSNSGQTIPPAPQTSATPQKQECQVSYAPLALQVQTLSGQRLVIGEVRWKTTRDVWNPGLRLLNCGKFAVFWNEGAVLLHRHKDVLEEILVDPDAFFGDVKWDGRNLWAGARCGNIRVLSVEGKEILRIGQQQGLPPCDQVLLIHPVREGKVVAVGCFGPHRRIWAAAVELAGKQAQVKVFYQGTRIRTPEHEKDDEGADLAAWPTWVHEHCWGKDKPRLLWVGRGSFFGGVERPRPLEINLETWEVSVSGMTLLQYATGTSMHSCGRFVVYSNNRLPALMNPPGEEVISLLDCSRLGEMRAWDGQYSNYILPWNKRLYLTGSPWCCIDPSTWQVDPLIAEGVPESAGCMGRWGVSMHHGIIFWRHHCGFYRVIIEERRAASETKKR